MQDNILRDSLVTHIYLTYTELGRKQVHKLKLRFIDAKQAYFSAEAPVNFEKPKRKAPAEIKVYTVDGVYRTEIFINDAQLNVAEVLFFPILPMTPVSISFKVETTYRSAFFAFLNLIFIL